ncbi:MAG: ATP-binding protein [Balneolaceae bacterium]
MSEKVFRLKLLSTYEESEKIPDFVTKIQEECNLDESITGTLMLVLSEAVTNAIVHGNKLKSSKIANVKVQVGESQIICTVQDEGDGFTPSKQDNPIDEENLLKDSGRGIFLINELSDEVKYLNDGTKIRFKLSRPSKMKSS